MKPIKNKKKVLISKMEPHWQEQVGSCGPASAKIILQYFKKNWSERLLRKMCRKKSYGTNIAPLIAGLRRTGAAVSAKSNGTLEDIKKFLKNGLPVMVAVWSPELGEAHFDPKWSLRERKENDCGHYAVVYGLSKHFVFLMDPDYYLFEHGNKTGRQRMSINKFLEHWYATDGQKYNKIKCWMLVINFDNRKFKGMKNYLPTINPKGHHG